MVLDAGVPPGVRDEVIVFSTLGASVLVLAVRRYQDRAVPETIIRKIVEQGQAESVFRKTLHPQLVANLDLVESHVLIRAISSYASRSRPTSTTVNW